MINRWPKPTYLPTPADIERECEAIQQGWDERERLRRLRFVVSDSRSRVAEECDSDDFDSRPFALHGALSTQRDYYAELLEEQGAI